MKHYIFLAALMMLSFTSFGQKKVAMLQTLNGDKDVEVKGIELNMVNGELTKAISLMDGYRAFTRTDVDLLMQEHNFQESGLVSKEQVKKIGEMAGADFICVSKLTKGDNEFYLEAYLIDVVTGEISSPATRYGTSENGIYGDLLSICKLLAIDLSLSAERITLNTEKMLLRRINELQDQLSECYERHKGQN